MDDEGGSHGSGPPTDLPFARTGCSLVDRLRLDAAVDRPAAAGADHARVLPGLLSNYIDECVVARTGICGRGYATVPDAESETFSFRRNVLASSKKPGRERSFA